MAYRSGRGSAPLLSPLLPPPSIQDCGGAGGVGLGWGGGGGRAAAPGAAAAGEVSAGPGPPPPSPLPQPRTFLTPLPSPPNLGDVRVVGGVAGGWGRAAVLEGPIESLWSPYRAPM